MKRLAALALVLGAASCGGDGGSPEIDFAWFETQDWAGTPVDEIDLARYLEGGSAAIPASSSVVLFRYTCDHCAAYFAELATRPVEGTLVLVHLPDEHPKAERVVEVLPEGHVLLELRKLARGYGVTAPVTFDVDAQRVVRNVVE